MNYLKTIFPVIFFSFLNSSVIGCISSDPERIAQQVLDHFQADEPEHILVYFDNSLKSQLSAVQLGNIWKGIIIQHGSFKEFTGIWTENKQVDEVVVLRCVFENTSLQLRLTFNENHRISGMFFQPDE